jgi:mono/diheme cytochrome c family protein
VRRLAPILATAVVACSACGGGGGGAPPAKGDARHGAEIFAEKCASCHGANGSGGTAPKLSGASISLDTARQRIDEGASGMPAGLVSGQDEEDVLAYLRQILAG